VVICAFFYVVTTAMPLGLRCDFNLKLSSSLAVLQPLSTILWIWDVFGHFFVVYGFDLESV